MPTLLFVASHPDDEVFGVSRPVVLHADDPNFGFGLNRATDGEAGEIAVGVDVTRDQLGAEEPGSALLGTCSKVCDSVERSGWPDSDPADSCCEHGPTKGW